MLDLSIALLAAAAAPPVSPDVIALEPAIVTAFMTLGRPGPRSASDVLAEAASEGWRGDGADRTLTVAGSALILHAADQPNRDERLQSCGIRTTSSIPNLAAAARTRLGFAPAVNLGTSATFFAIADADGWRSGATLDRTQFAAAKATGTFYSIVASTDDAGSTIYDIRTMSGQARSAGR